MSGLVVRNARVSWPDGIALDDVSLAVTPGERLAIVGPSGSGKSTLLRAIAGLEPLESGSVEWDDVDLVRVPVHRRGFALMFQDGQLFPHRDVAWNVGYSPRVRGRSPDRVGELLALVGLPGFEKRRVGTLSGGEQQRVALARSLAAEPRLLLLDEPLSALDRELRERLGADLREIVAATGTTTILVTHDQTEAFAIGERVAVMIDGRIVAAGTREELLTASDRIARFLGA
jgi:thiamine transport system ATP-binding protein